MGDMGGDLVVAPLILLWTSSGRLRWSRGQILEGAGLLAVLTFMTWTVFGGWLVVSARNYPIDFLCIPAVLWAAFRFGPRGAATALFILSAMALGGTLRNFGPFSREAQNDTLLLLQAFLGVTSVTAFAVAAEVRERRLAAENLAAVNAELDARKEEIATYHSLLTHDITNFAMALLGLLERLLFQADGPLTPKQDELLRRCNRQALEMNRMAENTRMLVRIREQGLPASGEPLVLRQVLTRATELVRDLHFDRPARFTVECPEDLEIAGTPLLENVFINLLDNAIRHTPKTMAPDVTVRAVVDMGRLRIGVRGGSPPPQSQLPMLFNRALPGRRASGHGIGLVLVREVLERAGATLTPEIVKEEGLEIFEVSISIPHWEDGRHSHRGGRSGPEGALSTRSGISGPRDPGMHGES
jgi:signal transduction histidine kinase